MSIAKDLLFIVLFFIAFFILKKNIRLKQELFSQRKTFIETLSHDLRVSTLAQIRGIDLLKKQIGENELANDIDESCKYSLDMINMLLNTYRYENGEQVLNYEIFNFSDSIKNCFTKLTPQIEEKELEVLYKINSSELINADKIELEKTLRYLISTTIFYAKRKSNIVVMVKRFNKNLEFSINYFGSPLSDEECRRMFSNNPRFSTVGHGIKMYLCKKIIEFHGGKIFVNSNGGYNSFTFIIPELKPSLDSQTVLNSKLGLYSL